MRCLDLKEIHLSFLEFDLETLRGVEKSFRGSHNFGMRLDFSLEIHLLNWNQIHVVSPGKS